jgi:phosphoglucomutase
MELSLLAGKSAIKEQLVDIDRLSLAYYNQIPDPFSPDQKVQFGTSGHRGSSLNSSFNEQHILAITQAICDVRAENKIDGPVFLGIDTHALSKEARESCLEVLTANGVTTLQSKGEEYTPTPAISHAIICYNKKKQAPHFADGIIITPSHNPPEEGGIKYNPPHGGPADVAITKVIEAKANGYLANQLQGIKRATKEEISGAKTTKYRNIMDDYIEDLASVIDFEAIRNAKIHLGVDPLGGAGVHYWEKIQERYGIDLTVVNKEIDPTFSFMTLDWDGKVRMDPSSSYAMRSLISLKDRFDVAFACDTDHDRHGIVTKSSGLLNPNHFATAAIYYLFQHRPKWKKTAGVGKTVVSSQMIDRVTKHLGKTLYEVPVGFKWFVEGLESGALNFVAEESAGATFNRFDGTVWTTDKDGITMSLLAAEMTAVMGKDPGLIYKELTKKFGNPCYDRVEAKATREQKEKLKKLSADDIHTKELAGEKIKEILTHAPGNGAAIGGVKVVSENGWFAARPSGTEDIYKIYVESFLGKEHLAQIIQEAEEIVRVAIS